MDSKTKKLIEKFRQDQSAAQKILQSGDGQQLLGLLTQNDGGAALERAAQSAAQGNTQELAALLTGLMKSPQGAQLLSRINEQAQR